MILWNEDNPSGLILLVGSVDQMEFREYSCAPGKWYLTYGTTYEKLKQFVPRKENVIQDNFKNKRWFLGGAFGLCIYGWNDEEVFVFAGWMSTENKKRNCVALRIRRME